MTKTLNNYTIDDFIKLKPVIYEYCVNLTQKKGESFWYRDLESANDLYQDVFLYVHDHYFNKPKEPMNEGKFTQIMKNYTYWTFSNKVSSKRKSNKVTANLNYYQDNEISEWIFQEKLSESPKYWEDFKQSLDYEFYTKTLKTDELKALDMYLDGYPIKEIDEKLNKYRGFFEALVRNKIRRQLKFDVAKPLKPVISKPILKLAPRELKKDDSEFLKSKIKNYEQVFNFKRCNDKWIKLYSLYLQGVNITEISKQFNSSKAQISVELYRIKQKIKKYEQ